MNRKKVVPFAKKYLSTRSSPGLLLQSSAARTCVATMNTAANPRKLWMCPIWVMRLANGAVMVVAIDDMAGLADTSTFNSHAEVFGHGVCHTCGGSSRIVGMLIHRLSTSRPQQVGSQPHAETHPRAIPGGEPGQLV